MYSAFSDRSPSAAATATALDTFGGKTVTVETHLLGVEEDLYHERLQVRFLERLRDEMRFDGAADLADQLARDRAAAASFFQNRPLRTA